MWHFINLHLLGTSILVLLSERPEYNKKIVSAHLMAPSAFIKHYNPILNLVLANLENIKVFFKIQFFFVRIMRKK